MAGVLRVQAVVSYVALSLLYTQALVAWLALGMGMFITLSCFTPLGYERYRIPEIDLDCIESLNRLLPLD
jgi:hypothetical protein